MREAAQLIKAKRVLRMSLSGDQMRVGGQRSGGGVVEGDPPGARGGEAGGGVVGLSWAKGSIGPSMGN